MVCRLGKEICTVVNVLCCVEWCRKWFGRWLKFGALWNFVRIFVKKVVLKILTVVSCEREGFVGSRLLDKVFFVAVSELDSP